jgi:hypothetical protein
MRQWVHGNNNHISGGSVRDQSGENDTNKKKAPSLRQDTTIKMSTRIQSGNKVITVIRVAWAALALAVAGGVYGFFTGGQNSMIIGFIEWFVAGFIIFYICASFIVLLRK